MCEPYVQSVQTHVPNTAADMVLPAEHRLLQAQGDDTLTGSKYVWLYGEDNVPDRHQERFTDLTRRRSRKQLKTARAWSLKQMAHGVRNRDNCKTAIYLYCGGLALYPDLIH